MGFGGGGGSSLSNHVHDNTPLQGGPLNFNNTTIGGMGAGDITFSDGNALQTLVYPAAPAGEVLLAAPASVAPAWGAASGSTTFTRHELVANQTIATWVLTDITGFAVTLQPSGKFICDFNCNWGNSSAVGGTGVKLNIRHDVTQLVGTTQQLGALTVSGQIVNSISTGGTCDGLVVCPQSNADVGSTNIWGTAPRYLTSWWVMEIG